jgi:hypothetical protein
LEAGEQSVTSIAATETARKIANAVAPVRNGILLGALVSPALRRVVGTRKTAVDVL